jgi:hypothetical protein
MSTPAARRPKDARRAVRNRGEAPRSPGKVEIEEISGRYLIRPAGLRTDEGVRLVGEMVADDAIVIVVAVSDELAEDLWRGLGTILGHAGRRRVILLAMSGAGQEPPGRGEPSLAQRIVDAWNVTVVAPAGDVVVVPGGALFALPAGGDTDPGWRLFAPGETPRPLGLRLPVPEWRTPLADTVSAPEARGRTSATGDQVVHPRTSDESAGTPAGTVRVTAVPAGILVHPSRTPPPDVGDLSYAIYPTGDQPSVLVTGQVTASALAAALAPAVTRPEWRRHPLRLVPADGGDLLPLGQDVARELELYVEVLTGPPVDLGTSEGPHIVVLDAEGSPAWTPFMASVLCGPPGRDGVTPPPTPFDWQLPVAGMRVADSAHGVLWLGDMWRLAVTRAGLWAYPADADPDCFPTHLVAARPVRPDIVRIDVGADGRTVDDEIWLLLDDVLHGLPRGPRARLLLAVHGTVTPDGAEALHVLTSRHAIRVESGATRFTEPSRRSYEVRVPAPPVPVESGATRFTEPSSRSYEARVPAPPGEETPAEQVPRPPGESAPAPVRRPTRSPAEEETPAEQVPRPPGESAPAPVRRSARSPAEPDGHRVPRPPGEATPTRRPAAQWTVRVPVEPAHSPPAGGPVTPSLSIPPPPSIPEAPVVVPLERTEHATLVPDPPGDEERAAFRAMVGLAWDRHAAPVRRTFSRLPSITATDRAAAAADLIAVRIYLTSPADGDFGPAAVRSGMPELRPYLSCLAAGLGRLPTYRGAVLRGVDMSVGEDLAGIVCTEPGPVGGVPLADGGWPSTRAAYVIWSDTARRVTALFDGGTEHRGVVFGPGTRFAVLDVRQGDADTPDLVLLRELPPGVMGAEEFAAAGRLARTRLDDALKTVRPESSPRPWSAYCLGTIGR